MKIKDVVAVAVTVAVTVVQSEDVKLLKWFDGLLKVSLMDVSII